MMSVRKVVRFALILEMAVLHREVEANPCPSGFKWDQQKKKCWNGVSAGVEKSWDEAQTICTEMDAQLAMIEDQNDQDFITNNFVGDAFWIAVRRISNASQYPDNSTVSWTCWAPGQPPLSGNDMCVIVPENGDRKWMALDCSTEKSLPLCMINKGATTEGTTQTTEGTTENVVSTTGATTTKGTTDTEETTTTERSMIGVKSIAHGQWFCRNWEQCVLYSKMAVVSARNKGECATHCTYRKDCVGFSREEFDCLLLARSGNITCFTGVKIYTLGRC